MDLEQKSTSEDQIEVKDMYESGGGDGSFIEKQKIINNEILQKLNHILARMSKEDSTDNSRKSLIDKSRFNKDDDVGSSTSNGLSKVTAWNRFIGTVRARLNVAKIVDAVKTDARLTFDFIILLIVASVVASFGLIENSPLFLAASMLISPLMGPILCATFGMVIKDRKLQYWGIRNELVGIFFCILAGFFFGGIVYIIDYGFGDEKLLTPEMLARCNTHSVIVGVFVALFSGAAVAIAVISENFGSLVGVAISASLLPPAVNTGLLWSFSCFQFIFQALQMRSTELFVKELTYSTDQKIELLVLGGISLCVTLTNVLCVFFMGYIILRIKIDVVPLSTEEEKQFWKHDVPIARDYNKSINAGEGKLLEEQLAEFRERNSQNLIGPEADLLNSEYFPYTHTWSPLTHRHLRRETRTSLQELDALYKSLSGKITCDDKHHRHVEFCNVPSPKHNEPRATTSEQHNVEIDSDQIKHQTTYVNIESNSNDEQDSDNGYRKFTVTPAEEPFI